MADKGKNSEFEYWWLLVFEWCHKTDTPFSIHVVDPTFKGIVPIEWIQGKLIPEYRKKKISIPTLCKDIMYSVFAKVEKGKLAFILF